MTIPELCPEPLQVDLQDVYVANAYHNILALWGCMLGGIKLDVDKSIGTIAEDCGLNSVETDYISQKSWCDAMELAFVDGLPEEWSKDAA